jgi:anti-sigma regulatory factor (Ser/Thr protein kinase)
MSGFRHEAFFYATDDEFLAGTVPFILDGVEAGEPVLALLPEPRLAALRTALETAAAQVTLADMGVVGRNPARIIPMWQEFVAQHGDGGRAVRGVGEPIWAGRTSDEIVECQLHEMLLNVAFTGPEPVQILCPYDVAALDPSISEQAWHSHRWLTRCGSSALSSVFSDPASDAALFTAPLRPAPAGTGIEPFDAAGLGEMRQRVGVFAAHAGLDDEQVDKLVLAVSEITTNSVHHGGGSGTLQVWVEGEAVVCQVMDCGRIEDPLVGRRRPRPHDARGRGLWLANQLCDLVQIRVVPEGSIIRVHERIAQTSGRPT